MKGNSFANGPGSGHGDSMGNGPGGPHDLTIAGVPLNPVPEIWNGMAQKGSLS